jgi:hypothetical protein
VEQGGEVANHRVEVYFRILFGRRNVYLLNSCRRVRFDGPMAESQASERSIA